ncbi:hypothetical protein LTR22_000572 [Elasticomyces elasticus]|nr:hypothetical protein LTR22_000572 [Elasticomyces elasticus]KAK4932037.1 hypothetical protein LTR49_001724 [Elasticomyces elasticus]
MITKLQLRQGQQQYTITQRSKTMATKHKTEAQRCMFLELPPELREIIYDYVYNSAWLADVTLGQDATYRLKELHPSGIKRRPALLFRACKALYIEALPRIYMATQFDITVTSSPVLTYKARKIGQHHGFLKYLPSIRRLRVASYLGIRRSLPSLALLLQNVIRELPSKQGFEVSHIYLDLWGPAEELDSITSALMDLKCGPGTRLGMHFQNHLSPGVREALVEKLGLVDVEKPSSSHNNPKHDNKRCEQKTAGRRGLLGLPAELRLAIYAYVYDARAEWLAEIRVGQETPLKLLRFNPRTKEDHPSLLPLTCKTLYKETLPLMYRGVHFDIVIASPSAGDLVPAMRIYEGLGFLKHISTIRRLRAECSQEWLPSLTLQLKLVVQAMSSYGRFEIEAIAFPAPLMISRWTMPGGRDELDEIAGAFMGLEVRLSTRLRQVKAMNFPTPRIPHRTTHSWRRGELDQIAGAFMNLEVVPGTRLIGVDRNCLSDDVRAALIDKLGLRVEEGET